MVTSGWLPPYVRARRVQASAGPVTVSGSKVRHHDTVRTLCHVVHPTTGRAYLRRVRAEDCHSLTLSAAGPLVGQQGGTVDWWPQAGRVWNLPDGVPAGDVAVQVIRLTGRHNTGRRWLLCPHCGRGCHTVYGSMTDHEGAPVSVPVIGCRTCLGLTDWARARHRCRDWAGAVLSGRVPVRSTSTRVRAQGVKVAAVGVMARQAGPRWSYLADLCESVSHSDTASGS